jgi:hypothetical protein
MINISTAKQLGIILPNTNKALEKVINDASKEELEVISKGKDLKSIMNNILKQSTTSFSANKELLDLVKNNPTLKNMGDVSTTIKDLLNSIKSDKSPLDIEKVLKNFLTDIKDIKNSEFKQKLENSGIVLESKLKSSKNPQVELKSSLDSLIKTIQKFENTNLSSTEKVIITKAKTILDSEPLKSASNNSLITKDIKETPKQLTQLASNVEKLISKLKTVLNSADSIHDTKLYQALENLEHKTNPKTLTPQNFKLSSIKTDLEQITQSMSKSFSVDSKSILNTLDKIVQIIKNIEQNTTTPKASIDQLIEKDIPKEITKLSQSIKEGIQKDSPIFSKDVKLILNKLESLNTPVKLHPHQNVKDIISNDLKAVLQQTAQEISQSPHANKHDILANIDKLSLQIDHYQLISHLSNSTSLYIPYSWDMLEDGNITMRKDDKDRFYCDINLKLKEYGELNLKLTLYDKNQLNLHIYSSNEKFKEIMRDEIPDLRSALIDMRITPREIRIYEPKAKQPTSPYQTQDEHIYMGFEVKA